ncbi:P-type DNA transfer protein VirB5 [Variovorax guangxiensis]|uniref:P-type DNA transfer protein VirB5 n=1 Tax=Variovorax guangxiensis TaxID=1775474 RepID=A0A3S0ZFH8_9BURK|nr:P-type DNA transfer protein VirB5 [Variovorax guangxiensis]RUR71891.1 P-type DNA transfer protein VirB5 [Variovorax guangxiensis]
MKVVKQLKKLVASIAIATGMVGVTAPAHAGIPVLDAANLAQAIQEVIAWGEQYSQMAEQITTMKSQLDQMKQQYQALTGNRNLGDIANNPLLKQAVPDAASLMSAYKTIQSAGLNGLSSAGQSQRQSSLIYNCEGRTGSDLTSCQSFLNNTSQLLANAQSALDLISQRTGQIQTLQSQINSTSDPKAIAELQARIAAENTQVSNDQNRVQLMNQMAIAQDRAAQQAIKERELKTLSRTNTTADTFTYTPR